MNEHKGIDLIRYMRELFSWCAESFNQQYTAEQLIRIADCMQKSKWDIFPDFWEDRQIQEAIRFNKVPDWEEKPNGEVVAIYTDHLPGEKCIISDLLGVRVEMTTGVVGKVSAIGLDNNFEVINENEGNEYRYLFTQDELKKVFLEERSSRNER